MASKRAFDEYFTDAAIKLVARSGIENMRTKEVAELAGFSEATMFRRFPTKEDLLRETFLSVDKRVSEIFSKSAFIRSPGEDPFELAVYVIWRQVYRYLVDNRDETLFLIRYRYSSLYTDEVRSMRQAHNGSFESAYDVFENHFGVTDIAYRGFVVNYIFEVTLCFAEKIVTGKIDDSAETERTVWLAVSNSIKAWTCLQKNRKD